MLLHSSSSMVGKVNAKYGRVLLMDGVVGLGALTAAVPLAFAFGGFMFIEPWIVVMAVLLFAAGYLRGSCEGSIWVKWICMNAGGWCFLVFWLRNELPTLLLMVLSTSVPTITGLFVRRRQTQGNIGPENVTTGRLRW